MCLVRENTTVKKSNPGIHGCRCIILESPAAGSTNTWFTARLLNPPNNKNVEKYVFWCLSHPILHLPNTTAFIHVEFAHAFCELFQTPCGLFSFFLFSLLTIVLSPKILRSFSPSSSSLLLLLLFFPFSPFSTKVHESKRYQITSLTFSTSW